MSFGALLGGTLVRLPPLRVGGYVVEHLTAAIATLVDLPVPIDGVLGANFMEAFRVGIDHRAKELHLEPARINRARHRTGHPAAHQGKGTGGRARDPAESWGDPPR
jgi:hypothetical protein